ncbi:MAG: hypothetical protein R2752_15280 [Vicinamibacterales bacterium]
MRQPFLFSTIVQLTSSPSGLSGQRSALRCILGGRQPPQRRRVLKVVVGAGAAGRLEAHRREALPDFLGALDADEHDAADTGVFELAAMLSAACRGPARSPAS